jgi:hypothetical protein
MSQKVPRPSAEEQGNEYEAPNDANKFSYHSSSKPDGVLKVMANTRRRPRPAWLQEQ